MSQDADRPTTPRATSASTARTAAAPSQAQAAASRPALPLPAPAPTPLDPAAKRAQALKLLDDHIGEHLRESERSGELRRAPSWGKPLDFGDGYDDTPPELRMPMKVLKDAGVVPPEVEALHRLAALRRDAAQATDPGEAQRLQQQASELEQLIRLRLERLRSGSL